MGDLELFYIMKQERNSFIASHKFYVEQAQKRLLAQFDDIDKEVDQYSENWLNDAYQSFDAESHDLSEIYAFSYEESVQYGMLLSEMRDQTIFSVIAGMYHQWDKQLRAWMAKESRIWSGKQTISEIWRVDINKIFLLFEGMGWLVKDASFFEKLDACRLIVNVYKHGNGGSLNDLRKTYPKYFYNYESEYFEIDGYFDHTCIHLKEKNLIEFSEAILQFWSEIPERFMGSQVVSSPDWLKKALAVDNKIQNK